MKRTRPMRHEMDVRGAWAGFVGDLPWDHVATLTFAEQPSEMTAVREVKGWRRRLEQRAGRRVDLWFSIERGSSGMRHAHTLTHGTARLSAKALRAAWRCGYTSVSRYDEQRGAAAYATKSLGDSEAVYDLELGIVRRAAS